MLKTKMARFVLCIHQRYMYALQITHHTFLMLTIHVFNFSSLPEPDELVGEIIPGSSPCEVQILRQQSFAHSLLLFSLQGPITQHY